MSPVSACASKWIIETLPKPWCRATPVASGRAIEWSPPSTSGTAPADGDGVHRLLEGTERALDLTGRHLDVAGVAPRAGRAARRPAAPGAAGTRRGPGSRCCRIACGPKRVPGRCEVPPSKGAPTTTTSASARAARVGQVDRVDAQERDVRAELRAVPCHGAKSYQLRRNPGHGSMDSVVWTRRHRAESLADDGRTPQAPWTGEPATTPQQQARDHLWMHFTRHSTLRHARDPDDRARRRRLHLRRAGPALPRRAGRAVRRAGRARAHRARRGGRQAGQRARVLPALVLRPPDRDRPGRAAGATTRPATSTGSSSPPAAARPSRAPGSSPSSTSSSPASPPSTR